MNVKTTNTVTIFDDTWDPKFRVGTKSQILQFNLPIFHDFGTNAVFKLLFFFNLNIQSFHNELQMLLAGPKTKMFAITQLQRKPSVPMAHGINLITQWLWTSAITWQHWKNNGLNVAPPLWLVLLWLFFQCKSACKGHHCGVFQKLFNSVKHLVRLGFLSLDLIFALFTILETLRVVYSCLSNFLFNKTWGLYSVFVLNCKTLSNFCCFKSKKFGFEGISFQMCLLPVFSVLYQFLFHSSRSTNSNQAKKLFCYGGYIYWERWADEFHFALIQYVV